MPTSFHRMILTVFIPIVALMACAPEPETSRETLSAAVIPTAAEQLDTEPTLSASTTPEPLAPTPTVPVDKSNQRHTVSASLDWVQHTVHVDQTIIYRNTSGHPLDELVLAVEPNQYPGQFTLESLAHSESPLKDFVLDGVRLAVALPAPLEKNQETTLTLSFKLTLPAVREGYQWGRLGYFGYTARQINLGMWFPLVAAYDPQNGWMTPLSSEIGEHFVLEAGDFDVTLTINQPPPKLRVAGPGTMTQPEENIWHFKVQTARELAVSLSAEFNQLATSTASGIDVELFYFPNASSNLEAPRHALHSAADAIAFFEELFGPCPYERIVIVQGDFPDGMEFSGLVFVSDDWFRIWQGIPNDWLTLITVHEVAHQWWYASVGNNQGLHPYLDEALAIYSELLFIERSYPEYVTWWWEFRINGYEPQGFVDANVMRFDSARSYINAVYLRGALMMDALRKDLGDEAFFEWLRIYAATMRGKLASPRDIWHILDDDAYNATRQTRETYFSKAEPLSPENPTEIP